MRIVAEIRYRLRALFARRDLEQELDAELRFHLERETAKLEAAGLGRAEAERRARLAFGGVDVAKEGSRDARGTALVETTLADVRYALRGLRARPAFAIGVALTLALGIGATSAMFTLVDGILLRPLPYADGDRLVRVAQRFPEKGLTNWALSQENVAQYRDRVPELQSFAAFSRRQVTYDHGGAPERIDVVRATGDYFTVLGVAPLIGRTFGRAEDVPKNPANVVVLSYAFWRGHFGGDRAVIGRVLDLDGQPTTVIGVMPESFVAPGYDAKMWLPLGLDPSRRFGWFLSGIGRLAPGATVGGARRTSTAVMQAWAATMPGIVGPGVDPRRTRMATIVEPLRTAIVGDSRKPLEVLQAAVALMLLIAIANVATLLSSRLAARRAELALRAALGATRGRIVRQLLTESVVLGLSGGAMGVALAWGLVHLLVGSPVVALPRLEQVRLGWRVVAFTVAVSVTAGVALGLAPALSTLRMRGSRDGALLLGGERGGTNPESRRLSGAMVAVQVALSVVLVVSATLVLESFQRLVGTDLGFAPAGVTTIALPLPAAKYADSHAVVRATDAIAERVRAVSGVHDAAIAWTFPFSGNWNTDGYIVEGHAPPTTAGSETQTVQIGVSPGYFRTLRIPLEYGRDFDARDRDGAPPVAIVDDAFAARYWNGGDAIGKRFRLTGDTTWFTIVGTVGSVRDDDPATPPVPHSYFPFAQVPDPRPMLALRTDGAATPPTIAAVRATIAEVESGIPLDNVRPLASWIDRSLDTRRLTELLLGGFALFSLALASVGLYGLMAVYVATRRREFGIRLALGGEPRHVMRRVVSQGLRLAAVGIAVGLGAALVATRWLRTLLYDVSATDPVVYGTLALVLLGVAALACFAPARRATRSDPMAALRSE